MASSEDRDEWRLTTDEKDFSWRALIGPVLTNRQYVKTCCKLTTDALPFTINMCLFFLLLHNFALVMYSM
jgi:hypothetical protein